VAVAEMKAGSHANLLVGGPNLAGQMLASGLVDEIRLFVWPVVLGGRNRALPTDVTAELEFVAEGRVGQRVVELRYRVLH
jgi:riboflavin biosynthesis pyrimidine reductase